MTDLSTVGDLSGMVVEEGDSLPGVRTQVLDSGVYPAVIDMAYLQKSQGGALMMMFTLKTDTSIVRDRFILTSGDKKGNRNYYVDQEGNKRPLPDLARADHFCTAATGKGLGAMNAVNKTIKLWDYSAQAEVPVEKEVIVDLIGKKIMVGLLKAEKNKRAQEDGEWRETNDKTEYNQVDKVFTETGHTVTEMGAKADAEFIEKWKARNEGRVVDEYKPVAGATVSTNSGPATSGATKPLFND
jgi:hypothetical protein